MTRGNRTIREKKPDDEKSIRLQFRLHPENPLELWALNTIREYEKRGVSLRALIPDALAAFEGKPLPERMIEINGLDVLDIKNALDYLVEQIQSGAFVQSGKKSKDKKDKEVELPESIRQTLNRYVSGGMSAEDGDES